MRRTNWAVLATLVLGACKERGASPAPAPAPSASAAAPLATVDVCDRLATLSGASWSARDKDGCLYEFGALGPNMRVCIDACVTAAKTYQDYDDCKDDCTGRVLLPSELCKDSDGKTAFDCRERFTELQRTQPEPYKCVARCARRAKTQAEVSACEPACKAR